MVPVEELRSNILVKVSRSAVEYCLGKIKFLDQCHRKYLMTEIILDTWSSEIEHEELRIVGVLLGAL